MCIVYKRCTGCSRCTEGFLDLSRASNITIGLPVVQVVTMLTSDGMWEAIVEIIISCVYVSLVVVSPAAEPL